MDSGFINPVLHEWGSFLLRWTHVIAAMAWIGASFYFMHLDANMRPAKGAEQTSGEAWEVHGGGFYQVSKWLVAPARLPDHLIWHKWQSYTTWLSGFALLCWVYYLRADLYLIDPAVRAIGPGEAAAFGIGGLALGWFVYDALCRSRLGADERRLAVVVFVFLMLAALGFQQVFSGRAAMLHTGAVIATWMTANVFFVIMPNQRKSIAALVAGKAPDPAWGKQAKTRSTHNNYLTLPVIFFMLSSHYPLAWSTPYAWVIVGLVVIAGGLIRHFYNLRSASPTHSIWAGPWWAWGVAAFCMALAAWISFETAPGVRAQFGLNDGAPETTLAASSAEPAASTLAPQPVVDIVEGRCSMCHAATPAWPGIAIAPKGVLLDTPSNIERFAPAIREQAVLSWAMPPNNLTGIEPDERRIIGAWVATVVR